MFTYPKLKPHTVKAITTYNSKNNNTYDPEPVTYLDLELTEEQKEEYKKLIKDVEDVLKLEQQLNTESYEEYIQRIAKEEEKQQQILSDLEQIAAKNDAEYEAFIEDVEGIIKRREEELINNAQDYGANDNDDHHYDIHIPAKTSGKKRKLDDLSPTLLLKTRLQTLKNKIEELKNKIGTRYVTKQIEELENKEKGNKKSRLHSSGGGRSKTTRRRRRRSIRRFHSRRTSMRRRSK
jgi:hypothetical protein